MARIVILTSIWLVTQVLRDCSSQSFLKQNFRCNNGRYVLDTDFCDHAQDCGDGSDQGFGCSTRCGRGRFDCGSDGPCIDIANRCNTIKDCPNGFDEQNCGNETDVEHCSLLEGKYLCRDKLRCLDLSKTCSGGCNCLDCSDESTNCAISLRSSDSCFSCAANCLPNYNGTQCVCNSGQNEMSEFCEENFSSINGQLCIRYKSIARCQCYENYHEVHQHDGIKCRHNVWLEQVLIYSTATKIKILNITTYGPPKIIQNEVNCSSLTAAKDYLYYTDFRDEREHIFKTPINGGKSEKITELDSTVKLLAVDWISSNLYFTSNDCVLVCSNDGRICTRLKCRVGYFALAPKFGLMFYVRNEIRDNEQLIIKSNMDGSEEKIFIDMTFDSLISLAVDEWTETVYIFEKEERLLYSFSLNGSNKTVHLFTVTNVLPNFSALERHLFFIKKNDNIIYNTTIPYLGELTPRPDEETNRIRNLFTYNPLVQFTYEIENPCTTATCNGLCLLRAGSGKNDLNHTCMCENFIPSDNKLWCGDHPSKSVLPLKSFTKNEASQIDSPVEPMPTSILKNDTSTSTKLSIVPSSPPESFSTEQYPATGPGYFNVIMFCMTFALGVSMLYLLNRINNSMNHRHSITSGELIEL